APVTAVLAEALPGDDEVAGRAQGHRRHGLVAGGKGVDPELAAHRRAGGVVALGVDAVAAEVLAVALPGHDVIAGRVRRDRRQTLFAGGDGVDARFRPGGRRTG